MLLHGHIFLEAKLQQIIWKCHGVTTFGYLGSRSGYLGFAEQTLFFGFLLSLREIPPPNLHPDW